MTESTQRSDPKSTASLVTEAIVHLSALMRKEIDLVRTEVNENLRRAAVGVGMIVGGVVFVLVALNTLSAALVAGLTELGIETGWSALIVGAVYLVIAIILVRKGTRDLKAASLVPTRAARSVRRDAQSIRETFHG